jgi:hypothetical protein
MARLWGLMKFTGIAVTVHRRTNCREYQLKGFKVPSSIGIAARLALKDEQLG